MQSLAKNFNVKARRECDNGSDWYAVVLQMLRAKPIGILCSLDVRTRVHLYLLPQLLDLQRLLHTNELTGIVDRQDLEVLPFKVLKQ